MCHYFKKSYEQELEIATTVSHNACISYCLPYSFGICIESHNCKYVECEQLFEIFYQLKTDTSITLHNELDEYYEVWTRSILSYTLYIQSVFKCTVYVNLLELDEKGALIVVDYKIKIYLKVQE